MRQNINVPADIEFNKGRKKSTFPSRDVFKAFTFYVLQNVSLVLTIAQYCWLLRHFHGKFFFSFYIFRFVLFLYILMKMMFISTTKIWQIVCMYHKNVIFTHHFYKVSRQRIDIFSVITRKVFNYFILIIIANIEIRGMNRNYCVHSSNRLCIETAHTSCCIDLCNVPTSH